MFSKFFQSIFTNSNNYIASTACDSVHVDAITGTARVMFKDQGSIRPQIYDYKNVSRRLIMKFIMDDRVLWVSSSTMFLLKYVSKSLLSSEIRLLNLTKSLRWFGFL